MSGRALRLSSFAKINLGLEVLGVRRDGYHELRTIFQTIDLRDDIELRTRGREVVVHCESPAVPAGPENLAWRAATELGRYARRAPGVEIRITKRIPVAGGLGGGSSNAAAVLVGLDRLVLRRVRRVHGVDDAPSRRRLHMALLSGGMRRARSSGAASSRSALRRSSSCRS